MATRSGFEHSLYQYATPPYPGLHWELEGTHGGGMRGGSIGDVLAVPRGSLHRGVSAPAVLDYECYETVLRTVSAFHRLRPLSASADGGYLGPPATGIHRTVSDRSVARVATLGLREVITEIAPRCEAGYYTMLGDKKGLEDLPEGSLSSPDAAFAYLATQMSSSKPLSAEIYRNVYKLLTGSKSSFRTETSHTYCVTRRKMDYSMLLEHGCILSPKYSRGAHLYPLEHSDHAVAVRLQLSLDKCNTGLHRATSDKERFHAIVRFYLECEQIQPMKESRRTNLAILNFLLGKYGLPLVLFYGSTEFVRGEIASWICVLDEEVLREQVKDGMRNWCDRAGVATSALLESL